MTTAEHSSLVTPAGARWLASACALPRSVHALWSARPGRPSVLPCGTTFDVISAPPVFGRRLVEQLWRTTPGSGPVAAHLDRVLVFAEPGTADRLRTLLRWEEWAGRQPRIPHLLHHGLGDAVTVPAVLAPPQTGTSSRWLVAPGSTSPWLPGAQTLLWCGMRAARGDEARGTDHGGVEERPREPIFAQRDAGANVYDVSTRR